MSILKHWHPVLKSYELGQSPKRITLDGMDYVIFRSHEKIAGYSNVCPHRRMKLSEGTVVDGRLTCPYHSWSFGTDGSCKKPSGGEASFTETLLEGKESQGLIWVKQSNSSESFPVVQTDGYTFVSVADSTISAPLELVLDNFTEVEHTSSVHAFLGYDKKNLSEVEIVLETTEDSVRLFNKGKQKELPFFLKDFLSIGKNDDFIDDWTTYFSPVHTVYDQYWVDPQTGRQRENKIKIYVFFVPIDQKTTQIFAITYLKYSFLGNFGWNLLLPPALNLLTALEIKLDTDILESLASHEVSLKGTKLTKFDKALPQNRVRMEKIYRGNG